MKKVRRARLKIQKQNLTAEQIMDVIESFTVRLEPVISLAGRYEMTRQGIYKILNSNGIDTTSASHLKVSCSCCGETLDRLRCEVRNKKFMFCDMECYKAFKVAKRPNSNSRNMWEKIAKGKIRKYFEIKKDHVIHWEDGKHYNCMLDNMMVFSNQGDHVRYHRFGLEKVPPIWSGDEANNTGR